MSTTLLLARHGQTLWHAENRYAGVSDVGLTDEGRAQAARLGEWAGRQTAAIDAVVTSTVSRAIVTAEPPAGHSASYRNANTTCANATSG